MKYKESEFMARFWPPVPEGTPLYIVLREALRRAITEGYWKPGERVPGEDEMTRITGMGLGTVQRALKDLSNQGLVRRRHGRGVGTRVLALEQIGPLGIHRRIEKSRGEHVDVALGWLGQEPAGDDGQRWQEALGARRLTRLGWILKDGARPMGCRRVYIDEKRFPGIARFCARQQGQQPLEAVLFAEFRALPASLRIAATAIRLPGALAGMLKARANSPVLRCDSIAVAMDGSSLYGEETFVLGEKFRIRMLN